MARFMKNVLFGVLFSGILILSLGFASAQTSSFQNVFYGVSKAIGFVFGDIKPISGSSAGEIFFIKFLVWVMLFSIIFSVVKRIDKFRDNTRVVLIISLAVSLIAVRYLTREALINFIWLPYGVLGIVFSVLLPFIIGFFFINGFNSGMIRRTGWATFFVVFAALAYMRRNSLVNPELPFNLAWLYWAIAILSLLLFVFDKSLRKTMMHHSLRKISDRKKRILAAKIAREIDELREQLAETEDERARRDIKYEIQEKNRKLNDLMHS